MTTETDDLQVRLSRTGLPARGVGERQAALPEPLRRFHRRLLGRFLTEAGPPDQAAVAGIAAELGLDPRKVLAVPNWLLRRDDQVGCLLFAPIDHLERR